MKKKTLCIQVYGIVQGVGFRPTVSRHAASCHIVGNVSNKGSFVEIHAQGEEEDVDRFTQAVKKHPPRRAVILKMDMERILPGSEGYEEYDTFTIIESEKQRGDIFVSPDIAICPECKKELYDPADRRYLHPFINCTCCGPRLTILDSMPYDRVRTSMGEFPMCKECEYEYSHAQTRRYDAQPVCCNECGPEVYLIGREERGYVAIRKTREVLARGGIVAIKGIGGFHLCCDAQNEAAVARLREKKRRPAKPFAVMMKDMETVERECIVEPEQRDILDGHQKPILLLERRKGGRLAKSVASDNPKVGVMLPYAPVQMLLFDSKDDLEISDLLVMTSGNVSGAPICREDKDAVKELSGFCDLMLSHNRKIRIRADDSVMDFFEGEPYMIRRSRGYAPLPFMLSSLPQNEKDQQGILAVGGELKNTFCIGKGRLFYPSPYIGDMADLRTVEALEESIGRMEELLETKPEIIACDLHPRYNTTELAERLAKKKGIPLIYVQHHYAHILSCMVENDWADPVIGVSFDGTGYGTDHTVWGGELLLADFHGFERKGSIEPFWQAGGDLSAKEGWRIAVSLLYDLYEEKEAEGIIVKLGLCDLKTAQFQKNMIRRRINTIQSTSAGRLFDGVSAILGIRKASTFEGEASITMEYEAASYEMAADKLTTDNLAADNVITDNLPMDSTSIYAVTDYAKQIVQNESSFYLGTGELVRAITDARLQGVNAKELACIFHRELASLIVAGCDKVRAETGVSVAALSGGVYQNKLLLRYTADLLRQKEYTVLTHHLLPPNDGGICVGQAVAAMHHLLKEKNEQVDICQCGQSPVNSDIL